MRKMPGGGGTAAAGAERLSGSLRWRVAPTRARGLHSFWREARQRQLPRRAPNCRLPPRVSTSARARWARARAGTSVSDAMRTASFACERLRLARSRRPAEQPGPHAPTEELDEYVGRRSLVLRNAVASRLHCRSRPASWRSASSRRAAGISHLSLGDRSSSSCLCARSGASLSFPASDFGLDATGRPDRQHPGGRRCPRKAGGRGRAANRPHRLSPARRSQAHPAPAVAVASVMRSGAVLSSSAQLGRAPHDIGPRRNGGLCWSLTWQRPARTQRPRSVSPACSAAAAAAALLPYRHAMTSARGEDSSALASPRSPARHGALGGASARVPIGAIQVRLPRKSPIRLLR